MALVDQAAALPSSGEADRNRQPATGVPLVLSVAEAAEALGVSDDLIYELIARAELPCLAVGRRKLIPRLAIELLVETAMKGFEPDVVLAVLSRRSTAPPGTPL
ncbi:MAG TPA: excisionase family DNA-binding protein [Acidimicrobiales bacterium]|nr:excisionase family DNA-binding protein [Acidimicrobiales bacterium]